MKRKGEQEKQLASFLSLSLSLIILNSLQLRA
jgi:hypothetical protein